MFTPDRRKRPEKHQSTAAEELLQTPTNANSTQNSSSSTVQRKKRNDNLIKRMERIRLENLNCRFLLWASEDIDDRYPGFNKLGLGDFLDPTSPTKDNLAATPQRGVLYAYTPSLSQQQRRESIINDFERADLENLQLELFIDSTYSLESMQSFKDYGLAPFLDSPSDNDVITPKTMGTNEDTKFKEKEPIAWRWVNPNLEEEEEEINEKIANVGITGNIKNIEHIFIVDSDLSTPIKEDTHVIKLSPIPFHMPTSEEELHPINVIPVPFHMPTSEDSYTTASTSIQSNLDTEETPCYENDSDPVNHNENEFLSGFKLPVILASLGIGMKAIYSAFEYAKRIAAETKVGIEYIKNAIPNKENLGNAYNDFAKSLQVSSADESFFEEIGRLENYELDTLSTNLLVDEQKRNFAESLQVPSVDELFIEEVGRLQNDRLDDVLTDIKRSEAINVGEKLAEVYNTLNDPLDTEEYAEFTCSEDGAELAGLRDLQIGFGELSKGAIAAVIPTSLAYDAMEQAYNEFDMISYGMDAFKQISAVGKSIMQPMLPTASDYAEHIVASEEFDRLAMQKENLGNAYNDFAKSLQVSSADESFFEEIGRLENYELDTLSTNLLVDEQKRNFAESLQVPSVDELFIEEVGRLQNDRLDDVLTDIKRNEAINVGEKLAEVYNTLSDSLDTEEYAEFTCSEDGAELAGLRDLQIGFGELSKGAIAAVIPTSLAYDAMEQAYNEFDMISYGMDAFKQISAVGKSIMQPMLPTASDYAEHIVASEEFDRLAIQKVIDLGAEHVKNAAPVLVATAQAAIDAAKTRQTIMRTVSVGFAAVGVLYYYFTRTTSKQDVCLKTAAEKGTKAQTCGEHTNTFKNKL